jgi:hypothetical protein
MTITVQDVASWLVALYGVYHGSLWSARKVGLAKPVAQPNGLAFPDLVNQGHPSRMLATNPNAAVAPSIQSLISPALYGEFQQLSGYYASENLLSAIKQCLSNQAAILKAIAAISTTPGSSSPPVNLQPVLDAISNVSKDIQTIISNEEKELMDLTALTAAVSAQGTVVTSVVTLLDGIAAQLTAAQGDPAAVAAAVAGIQANSAALSAAVVANTPAAPPATTT